MSTLAGTTWTFSTAGNLQGEIAFRQVGPSSNAGMATITATNPPVGYNGDTQWDVHWAEAPEGGNCFSVQFQDFETSDGYNPPPLGLPTINAGQIDMQPITLWGAHQGGLAMAFGTNFADAAASFHMTKKK